MRGKKSSGILVTFSGVPYTTSNFFLDNGMANLAGALIQEKHDVLIIDLNTPDILINVVDKNVFKSFQKAWDLLHHPDLNVRKESYDLYKNVQKQIDRNTEQFQLKIYQRLSAEIIKRKADFIGFKLWLGRGIKTAIYLAKNLRRQFPSLKIYGGGPLAQLFTEQIFSLSKIFDALVVSEGEMDIVDLANYALGHKNLNTIPNLAYFCDNEIKYTERRLITSLDDLPDPVYDESVYPEAHNKDMKIRVVTMDESRGCNRHCAFCTHGVLGGKPVRTMSNNRVLNLFKKHIETLDTRVFNLGGSCVPYEVIEGLTAGVRKDKLDIIFNCFTNAEDIKDTSRLADFRRGGLFSVFFGLESLDEKILHRDYLKMSNQNTVINNLKKALDAGIYVTGSIIYPAPRENFRSTHWTLKKLTEIFKDKPNGTVVVFYPGLMPHSIWSKHLSKFNIVCRDLNKHFAELMNCEIRHFLPPSFWQTYDYEMNNRKQRELAILSDKFSRALQRRGVSINAMGDSSMLGFMLGINPKEFGSKLAKLFLTGDGKQLQKLVRDINAAISKVPMEPPENWVA